MDDKLYFSPKYAISKQFAYVELDSLMKNCFMKLTSFLKVMIHPLKEFSLSSLINYIMVGVVVKSFVEIVCSLI